MFLRWALVICRMNSWSFHRFKLITGNVQGKKLSQQLPWTWSVTRYGRLAPPRLAPFLSSVLLQVSPAVWVFPFTLSPSTWLERGRLTVGSSPYNPNHCEALVDVIWHYITKVYWIDHNSSPSEYKDHWWLLSSSFLCGFHKKLYQPD